MNSYTIKSYVLFISGLFSEIRRCLANSYRVAVHDMKMMINDDFNDDYYLKVIKIFF